MPLTERSHDEHLLDYLLGKLPAEETERLDERSITDDDFAAQLSDAENDLVDAYVRGQLASETAERFRAVYLAPGAPPARRQRVRFAEIFLSFEQRSATASEQANRAMPKAKGPDKSWRMFFSPVRLPQWGMAVAAVVLLVATGYLSVTNQRLRQRAQQLEGALNAPTPATAVKASNQPSRPAPDQLRIVALVLAPASRGVASLPSVSVPPGTDLVLVELRLEAGDFKQYRVALENPATRETLWRSPELKPSAGSDEQTVSFALSADLLTQGNYILQLSGIHANKVEEPVSSYPFRANTIPGTGTR